MKIRAVPLTAAAFAPYGQVLEGTEDGEHRHQFAANVVNTRPAAKLNTTYMKAVIPEGPVLIPAIERHEFSNQTFVPMNGTSHLVAACPSDADGNPDLSKLVAFVASGSQAVNYNPLTWHAPRRALSGTGEFIMLRWDDGSKDDTDYRTLENKIEVIVG